MFFTSAQFLTALNQLKLINEMTGSYVQPTVNLTDFARPIDYPCVPKTPDWLTNLDHPIDF